VGNLMYAMVSTRPDISHAVGVVSRFMENLGEETLASSEMGALIFKRHR